MKLYRFSILLIIAVIVSAPLATAEASNFSTTIALFKKSIQVRPFFETAYGYAVFPTVGKGAFYVGAAYGEGQVYQSEIVTGKTTITKLSLGFQFGGKAFSQIIFFQDKRAYDEFTAGNFEFGANLSAVAVTAGAQAEAGTTGATAGASAGPATGTHLKTGYVKGMAVFVHAKGGLMLEASVSGQKFTYEPIQ